MTSGAGHDRSARLDGWRRSGQLGSLLAHAVLLMGAVFVLLPFVWMLLTAIRAPEEILSGSLNPIPQRFYGVENVTHALNIAPLHKFMLNGLIVCVGILAVQLLVSIHAAYALAKLEFPGRSLLFALVIAGLSIPIQVPALPLYLGLAQFKLLDTYFAMMLPFFLSVFAIFLFRQVFKQFPDEIRQAARVDGLGEMEILWRIVVPSAWTAITAFSIFSIVAHWNDLYWPMIVIQRLEYAPPPLGDTLDRRLDTNGISLRVRRVGEAWLQTVKVGTKVRSGISAPFEAESTVGELRPEFSSIADKALRKRLRSIVGRAPLVPLFETIVERSKLDVQSGTSSKVEIAFDSGVIRAQEGVRDICEIELELKSGRPDALIEVAESLFAGESLRLSRVSKAERGYALVDAKPASPPRPLGAASPNVCADQRCGEALCEIANALTNQILVNWQVVLDSDDPEGVHQLRIGLRRLRSALKAFRAVASTEALQEVHQGARDIGRLLSELRKVDVLAAETVGIIAEPRAGSADLSVLSDALSDAAKCKRASARAAFAESRFLRIRLCLALFPYTVENLVAENENKLLARPVTKLARQANGQTMEKSGTPRQHDR